MKKNFNEHDVFIDDVSPPKRKNLKRKILTSRLSKIERFSHNFTIVNLLRPKLLINPHIYKGAGSKV